MAGTQNKLCFFFPWLGSHYVLSREEEYQESCSYENCLPVPLHSSKHINQTWLEHETKHQQSCKRFTPWWTEPHADFMTETMSVFLVKTFLPSTYFSCWRAMVMAAPPMNQTITAWHRNSIKKPQSGRENRSEEDAKLSLMKELYVRSHLDGITW